MDSSTTGGGVVHPPAGHGRAELAFMLILCVAAVATVGTMRRRGVLRRDALRQPRRTVAMASAPAWLAGAAGVFAAAAVAGALALQARGLRAGQPATLADSALSAASAGLAGIIAGLVAIIAIAPGAVRSAGFAARWSDAARALGALLLALPIVWLLVWGGGLVQSALQGAPTDDVAHTTLRLMADEQGSAWWWVMAAVVVLVTPVQEELLYRGFLQSAAVRAIGAGWAPVLLTSAVFALAHAGAADWRALPGLFALGAALGLAFERTGRLGVCIGMHALFNLLNILISL